MRGGEGGTMGKQDILRGAEMVSIPVHEAWLFKNKRAANLVRQGLEDARQGRLVKAKIVARTAGLLGKRFPSGVIYQRRLRHSTLTGRKTMSYDKLLDVITIEARRHEAGRPLRDYLAERSGRRAKRRR